MPRSKTKTTNLAPDCPHANMRVDILKTVGETSWVEFENGSVFNTLGPLPSAPEWFYQVNCPDCKGQRTFGSAPFDPPPDWLQTYLAAVPFLDTPEA